MSREKLNIAIVGLGFGKEFIPIYQNHPNTNMYAICQRTREKLDEVGDAVSASASATSSFEDLIEDPNVDAVHINSPIHLHAPQSIAALKAGKHVACTVPAATTVDECREIVSAATAARKNYMMMETAIYTREFLFVRELRDSGKLGRIQFMRGSHQQEMAGWPGYWEGLPPMHYATHAVSPCLALVRGEAEYVSCFGSGRIEDRLIAKYGSPFAVESALFKVRNQQLSFEVTRSLFETARQYRESFDVYGDKVAFEWAQIENERPGDPRGREARAGHKCPTTRELLPEPIQRFTTKGVYDDEHAHLSFIQGGGHGGSHPHLVHEFVSSIIEGPSVIPGCVPVGELDVRRHLRARVGHAGRANGGPSRFPRAIGFRWLEQDEETTRRGSLLMTRSNSGSACLLAFALSAVPVTAQSPSESKSPAATVLRLQQNETAGTIAVFRQGGQEPILTQIALPDNRPYLHPIVAPDGKGVLTEYRPAHHLHQTGVYLGVEAGQRARLLHEVAERLLAEDLGGDPAGGGAAGQVANRLRHARRKRQRSS